MEKLFVYADFDWLNALHDWQFLARKLGIANREIEIFTHRWVTSFQP